MLCTYKITKDATTTIVRNIYECFRMLGDALLVLKGIKSEDHVTAINELLKLDVKTSRPILLVDNLRRLKHNINYYGYKPTLEEAADAVSVAKACFEPLFDAVFKEIK